MQSSIKVFFFGIFPYFLVVGWFNKLRFTNDTSNFGCLLSTMFNVYALLSSGFPHAFRAEYKQ